MTQRAHMVYSITAAPEVMLPLGDYMLHNMATVAVAANLFSKRITQLPLHLSSSPLHTVLRVYWFCTSQALPQESPPR